MMRRSSTSVAGNYARDDINNGGGGTNRRGHLVGTPSRRYRTVALPCLYSIREVNQKLGSLDLDIGVGDSSRDDTPDNPVVVNARLSPSLEATTTDLQQLPLVRLSGKTGPNKCDLPESEGNEGDEKREDEVEEDQYTIADGPRIATESVVLTPQVEDIPIYEISTAKNLVQGKQTTHKSLKDLIFETNRAMYNVDSNKIRYKAGLSRNIRSIPSLHPRR